MPGTPESSQKVYSAQMCNNHCEGVYLGFDYGEKRIGVACGKTITRSVMPVAWVSNHSGTPDWASLDTQISEWQPVGLVVGEPLDTEGHDQEITRQARGFAKRLGKRYKLPVFMIDERYSSIEASRTLKNSRSLGARGKTRRSDMDRIAAAVLLQRWLDDGN